MDKKQKKSDAHNQRVRTKVLKIIESQYKNPNDIVQPSDVVAALKQQDPEFQRKPEKEISKMVKWQMENVTKEVTGTNIIKGIFKKRDFFEHLNQQYLEQSGRISLRKRELKAEDKIGSQGHAASGSDEAPANEQEHWDNENQKQFGDKPLILHESKNTLNNMLPCVKEANEEAEAMKKKEAEMAEAQAARKRQKVEGLKAFTEKKNESAQMEEMTEKFRVTSNTTFTDVGGMADVISQIKEMVEWPIKHQTIFEWLGAAPPKGILITGPPGCGKTLLAMAIAGQNSAIPFYKLTGPEIVTGISGKSEELLRHFFKGVQEKAPAIVFIDELDSVAGKRENAQKDLEVRIVAQLASCMDEISQSQKQVVIIGCTSRPETIDTALRRAGRFEREVNIGVPNEDQRIEIMKILSKEMRLRKDFPYEQMVKLTPGYVGADIHTLCKEASIVAVRRILNGNQRGEADAANFKEGTASEAKTETSFDKMMEDIENFYIDVEDFEKASKMVQPSAQREGFSTVPNTTWQDIGALSHVRQELQMSIVEPILNPQRFARVGLSAPAGVLLYGPPGCGKTLVARAVSNESKANFISIKGPELLNKYVGESEKAVRQLFKRAKSSAPCVIFFDELDSLVPKRGSDGNNSSERVVNQLLTEMDGLEDRNGVFVIAATNRPDIIDPAMLRPGRLDKLLYVPLPTKDDRHSILKTLAKSLPLDEDVELRLIAHSDSSEGYSGADLSALVREAQLSALKSAMAKDPEGTDDIKITNKDFMNALKNVFPSVSKKDELTYQKLQTSLRRSRGHIDNVDAKDDPPQYSGKTGVGSSKISSGPGKMTPMNGGKGHAAGKK